MGYAHTSIAVFVMVNEFDHLHEEGADYVTGENYHWTANQEDIVLTGVRNNTKNSLILRTLRERGATNGSGRLPTAAQVFNT